MRISDRVTTRNIKPFMSYEHRPSVAMRLVDTRANGKTGLILERANEEGWWIVLHDTPVGQGAVYHESELTVVGQNNPTANKYTRIEPDQRRKS